MHITRAQSYCLAHVHLSPWNFVAELIANICDLFPFSNTITLCLINLPASLISFQNVADCCPTQFFGGMQPQYLDPEWYKRQRICTTVAIFDNPNAQTEVDQPTWKAVNLQPFIRAINQTTERNREKRRLQSHIRAPPQQCPSTAVYTYCKADAATLYPQFHKRHGKSTRRAHRIFGIAAFCTFRSWQLSGVGGARHFESYLSHLVWRRFNLRPVVAPPYHIRSTTLHCCSRFTRNMKQA